MFCGSLKLQSLPDTLKHFYAYNNKFTGSVDLTRLPAALSCLHLENNRLSGSVVLTQLPGGLEVLNLKDNQFSANPTKGHLSVVGWTSTPVLGEAKNLFKPLVVFLSWRRPY
ncbi:hypothetical protein XU18_3984 [Perkinsela sp. CCAP 1560/4]|nr:hypothetical protein XU18_3984 [Perkinsela sp. CCAP 1560/4]|eukprot:KNH04859.1 hypothetical protein XU18_3984 [Perkinsela sp. CCAP 1560/4]